MGPAICRVICSAVKSFTAHAPAAFAWADQDFPPPQPLVPLRPSSLRSAAGVPERHLRFSRAAAQLSLWTRWPWRVAHRRGVIDHSDVLGAVSVQSWKEPPAQPGSTPPYQGAVCFTRCGVLQKQDLEFKSQWARIQSYGNSCTKTVGKKTPLFKKIFLNPHLRMCLLI